MKRILSPNGQCYEQRIASLFVSSFIKKCADKTEENEESCLVRSYNSDKTIQFSKILNVGFLYYTVGPISHIHDEVKHCCGAVDRDLTICCW